MFVNIYTYKSLNKLITMKIFLDFFMFFCPCLKVYFTFPLPKIIQGSFNKRFQYGTFLEGNRQLFPEKYF